MKGNLFKPNLIGPSFCVWNRQVFNLYRLFLQRCPTSGLYGKIVQMRDLIAFLNCKKEQQD